MSDVTKKNKREYGLLICNSHSKVHGRELSCDNTKSINGCDARKIGVANDLHII